MATTLVERTKANLNNQKDIQVANQTMDASIIQSLSNFSSGNARIDELTRKHGEYLNKLRTGAGAKIQEINALLADIDD